MESALNVPPYVNLDQSDVLTVPTPTAWRKRATVILWTLSLGQLLNWGIIYYTFPLFIDPMGRDLGWSRTSMFGALSAGLLTASLGSIPIGARIDRGHGRKLMVVGAILSAFLFLLWSAVASLKWFYFIWIGLGAC
jgi:MFS family permease